MAKKSGNVVTWAFWVGAVLAIIAGIGVAAGAAFADNIWIPVILVVAGLIVGFANISAKETVPFLVAAIALAVLGGNSLTSLNDVVPQLGTLLTAAVSAFALFIAAAAIVVAVREAWNMASN